MTKGKSGWIRPPERWATGCNSRAGEAHGAGSESPTVLPENEGGPTEEAPWHVSRPGSGPQEQAIAFPASWI